MPDTVGGQLEMSGVWAEDAPISVYVDFRWRGTFDSPDMNTVFRHVVNAPGGLEKLSGVGVAGEVWGGPSAVIVVAHIGDELVELVGLGMARGAIMSNPKEGSLLVGDVVEVIGAFRSGTQRFDNVEGV